MPNPTQFDPDRVRVVLDHGEVVELDGGTLALNGEEFPSVLLRLTPWRARSVARVLREWSSVSRIFHHPTRPPRLRGPAVGVHAVARGSLRRHPGAPLGPHKSGVGAG